MDRRKSLKILGASGVGIAGLVLVDWKWQLVDRLTHAGFFSFDQEKVISAVANTLIPEGLPPVVPSPDSKPIGALSTGTDQFLIALFEKCYETEDQEAIKLQLDRLKESGFLKAEKQAREAMLMALSTSENEAEKEFFKTMKSETITGFTTVREVMVDYRKYKVAPGIYFGCVDEPAEKA